MLQRRVEAEGRVAGEHGQEAGRGSGEDVRGPDADAEAAGPTQLTQHLNTIL